MEIKVYASLPQDARRIREEVFVREQGFQEEFDEIDEKAEHMVLYEGEKPIAVCRFYPEEGSKEKFFIGRIAVDKAFRGRHLGAGIVTAAEEEIRKRGGKRICLHAQTRVEPFYQKLGYESTGERDLDEDCPHTWMSKTL